MASGEPAQRGRLREGSDGHPRWPWYRSCVLVYDRLYRVRYGLDRRESEVGSVLRINVRRSHRARTLPDGTRLCRGASIGVLHLNNETVTALHWDDRSPLAVGLEFRCQFSTSLHQLAVLTRPGGPLSEVRAFAATTIFHRGLRRFGFRSEPDGLFCPVVVALYQRALLASLHPVGTVRLRSAVSYRASRVWISSEALVQRYG